MTGALSRAALQPFDVLKIRFQLQAEAKASAKYKSLLSAAFTITREEGLRALWKGHVSGQCLSVTFGTIQFGLYQSMWYKASDPQLTRSKARVGMLDMAFGMASAVPGTIISYPFDVVRTRMVGQGGHNVTSEHRKHQYRSMTEAFVRMIKYEGVGSLYNGLAPALYTVPLAAGLHFCIYNYIKPLYAPYVTKVDGQNVAYLSHMSTIFFGGLSGALSKTLTFPLDTVKKRLQVQGFDKGRQLLGKTPKYTGFSHCFKTVLAQEGLFRGLYKGWLPGILKAFPSGAIQFYLLETSMYLIARLKKNNS